VNRKIPPENPRSVHRRKVIAARRVGEGRKCSSCGEVRPEALIPKSDPMTCAECQRRSKGQKTTDDHHIAGAANNPGTIAVAVNDHRANLSTAQQDWPSKTLQNPDHSPLLSAAAHIRGFADTVLHLILELLLWIADMLELLDTHLIRRLGQKWWERTKLKAFEPKT
jgi:hypothetical protein